MRKNLISEFFGLFLLISAMVASLGIGAVVSARTGIENKGVPLILSGLLKSHSGEIQDQSVFFQEEMAGFWMLFIHFSEATQTVDMVLDSKGNIIQSSDPSLAGKSLLIGKNGRVIFISSDQMRFAGYIQQDGHYLDGMANVKDIGPVPFSACKISDKKT